MIPRYAIADFAYPTVTEGKDSVEPIPFLAQINFRRIPHIPDFFGKGYHAVLLL